MYEYDTEIYSQISDCIPHTVTGFGISAQKDGEPFELAFNGPVQRWTNKNNKEDKYGVAVRLARIKDNITKELYSKNIFFYCKIDFLDTIHNIYDFIDHIPHTVFTTLHSLDDYAIIDFSEIHTKMKYHANEESVILEDLRFEPIVLPNGNDGWFVTGQGYRGKLELPTGALIHDVGVYGNYIDPEEMQENCVLHHLFGGLKFYDSENVKPYINDADVMKINANFWIKGLMIGEDNNIIVQSCKNSVLLPRMRENVFHIGARTMTETKKLYYFRSEEENPFANYHLQGEILGLENCFTKDIWKSVRRIGLGSNFIRIDELDGFLGFAHVVLSKNDDEFLFTKDSRYPKVKEQYEGWAILLKYIDEKPVITVAKRAITPDDFPEKYVGLGELFEDKRVAFPTSLYKTKEGNFYVAYGWGDRAIFSAEFKYDEIISALK